MMAPLADIQKGGPVVVTGQQAGLFGGPMYTLYKLLGAIALAKSRGSRPVFWVECDDADIIEVDQATVVDIESQLRHFSLDETDDKRPVAARTLGPVVTETIDRLSSHLPSGELATAALNELRQAYHPGARWHNAFSAYLGELVGPTPLFFDPTEAAAKEAAKPLFLRVLNDPDATEEALAAGAELFEDPPIAHRPGELPLFLLDDKGTRRRILRTGDGFELRGGLALGRREATELLDRSPERFSPAVALRPIVQDFLLPTETYVAGPSEAKYHAQLGPLYELFEVDRPDLAPRPAFTLLEPRAKRALEKLGATYADLEGGAKEIIRRATAARAGVDPRAKTGATAVILQKELSELRASLGAGGSKNLDKVFDEATRKIDHQLERLGNRAADALARLDGELTSTAEKAEALIRPNGKPQERLLSPIHFLARIPREELLNTLASAIDPSALGRHQVLEL